MCCEGTSHVQLIALGAIALSSLAAGCVTIGAYGGIGLVVDQERHVGLRIGGGAEPGLTSNEPDRDRAFTALMTDVGAGLDLVTREPFAEVRIGALGFAYHSPGAGHRASVGVQFRFSARGHTAGPSIGYAFEHVVDSRRERGPCPDEGQSTFRAVGSALALDLGFPTSPRSRRRPIATLGIGGRYSYASYAHVHPLTDCLSRDGLRLR
jgi:hypothetical protein